MVKRCELEEHRKTNESNHLELTALFAVNKMGELEESIAQFKEEKANNERLCKLEMEMEQSYIYQKEMKAIIERLSYPIALRDVIRKDIFEVLKGASGK